MNYNYKSSELVYFEWKNWEKKQKFLVCTILLILRNFKKKYFHLHSNSIVKLYCGEEKKRLSTKNALKKGELTE